MGGILGKFIIHIFSFFCFQALDSAVFHKGRVRSFPHEKNNWASFIYIDVSDLELDEVRSWLVKELDLEPTEDTHVSLSRTVSLRNQLF